MQIKIEFFKQFFSQDFTSEYSHSNYIDKTDGKIFFHMDCSGFVYWCLLQMGYKRALVELRSFLKQNDFIKINRFFCKDFVFIHKYKNKLKYWKFIDKPVSGSIIVVVFSDGNGHCMFVDTILRNDRDNLTLRIIDSTNYPHKNDTRNIGGIGIGDIEITKKKNTWLYDSGNSSLPIRKAQVFFVLTLK